MIKCCDKIDWWFFLTLIKNTIFSYIFLENVELELNLKTNVEHRNGKDYVTINSISTSFNALDIKFYIENRNTPRLISDMVNHVVNANCRIFKNTMDHDINEYAGDLIKSFLILVFNQIAIQDVFYMNVY